MKKPSKPGKPRPKWVAAKSAKPRAAKPTLRQIARGNRLALVGVRS